MANLLGVKKSFIGNIENPNIRAKYNIKHINILACYFDLYPRDFLPEKPLPFDTSFLEIEKRSPVLKKGNTPQKTCKRLSKK
ncbi:MAG: hypothetical protein JST58_05400 [Bacteroidetes bacterium]|nr:hypothetical protein [Bacteroidota bacterium]